MFFIVLNIMNGTQVPKTQRKSVLLNVANQINNNTEELYALTNKVYDKRNKSGYNKTTTDIRHVTYYKSGNVLFNYGYLANMVRLGNFLRMTKKQFNELLLTCLIYYFMQRKLITTYKDELTKSDRYKKLGLTIRV
jgi:hypothetical protein